MFLPGLAIIPALDGDGDLAAVQRLFQSADLPGILDLAAVNGQQPVVLAKGHLGY